MSTKAQTGNDASTETIVEPTDKAQKPKGKKRGFAAMDPKLVSELARRGGKAAHKAGKAHQFTSAEAREAGRKGGLATHKRKRDLIDFDES